MELVAATPDGRELRRVPRRSAPGRAAGDPGGQFVHGRSVPMGGIAAVVVRPEARGAGVARRCSARRSRGCATPGIAVSSLHPGVDPRVPERGLGDRGPGGMAAHADPQLRHHPRRRRRARSSRSIRPGAPRSAPATPRTRRACPAAVDRSRPFWVLHERGGREDGAFLYGVRTDGVLTGYVAYTQTSDPTSWAYDLRIDDVVAHDRASAVALWRFIGGHSMQVEQVQVPLGALPALVVPPRRAGRRRSHLENHWMHRIVDVPGADRCARLPGRCRAGRSPSLVTDPLTPGTTSAWRITVDDGAGCGDSGGRRRRRGHARRRRAERARDRRDDRSGCSRNAGRHRRRPTTPWPGSADCSRPRRRRSPTTSDAGPGQRLESGQASGDGRAAVDGAPGGDQAPLGAVEVAGDRGIVGVAVAVGDRHDPRASTPRAPNGGC